MDERLSRLQTLLKLGYGIIPIVAGLDKFFNILTDWEKYLSPLATRVLPLSGTTLMHAAGVVEIAAGILVLTRWTRFAAYVVAAWLVAIALNLVLSGQYFDVAVRDLVMAAGAYALAVLTAARGEVQHPVVEPLVLHP
jgi:uncharacterized membrane protein YphA (DoxX/SURF4 family)